MIKDAKAIKAEGRPIVIFPEGTRTAAGSSGDYQAGVSALYLQLDLPVVPVALNSGLYWPRRTVLKRPGRRSEEHTSDLQSLMRISYAVFCLKKKKHKT